MTWGRHGCCPARLGCPSRAGPLVREPGLGTKVYQVYYVPSTSLAEVRLSVRIVGEHPSLATLHGSLASRHS